MRSSPKVPKNTSRVLLIVVAVATFAAAGVYAYRVFYHLTIEQALTERLGDVKPGMTEAEVEAIFGKPDRIEDLHRPGIDAPCKLKFWKAGKAQVEVEFDGGLEVFKQSRTQYDMPRPTTSR
jgi:hypothetical protein